MKSRDVSLSCCKKLLEKNTEFLTLVAAAAGSWSPCRLQAAQDRRCRLICRSLSASSRGSHLMRTTATSRKRQQSSQCRQDSRGAADRAATEWRSLNPSIAFATRPAAIVTELAFSTLPVCFETIPAEEPLTWPIVAVIPPPQPPPRGEKMANVTTTKWD